MYFEYTFVAGTNVMCVATSHCKRVRLRYISVAMPVNNNFGNILYYFFYPFKQVISPGCPLFRVWYFSHKWDLYRIYQQLNTVDFIVEFPLNYFLSS